MRLSCILCPSVQRKAAGRGRINYDWVDYEKGGGAVVAVDGSVMAIVMSA